MPEDSEIIFVDTAKGRKRYKEMRAQRRRRNKQAWKEGKYETANPGAKAMAAVDKAELLAEETKNMVRDVKRNFVGGAAKLAESYGALLDDHLELAFGEEVKTLQADGANAKVVAAAIRRQERAREYLLTLGSKILPGLEGEEGQADVDPMVEAARRIANANVVLTERTIEVIPHGDGAASTVEVDANPG